MPGYELTILSEMAGPDFEAGLDRQRAHGIRSLDLKGGIYGKRLIDLTDAEAQRAAAAIRARGLTVHCFSTVLFHAKVEQGEAAFRRDHLAPLARILELAAILRPRLVRLLVAETAQRHEVADAVAHVRAAHPWLFALYREAIDQIHAAGCTATIENEVGNCLVGGPDEALALLAAIDRPDRVRLTWDIQNMWQVRTYPSLETYRRLRPHLDYVHFKGGISATPGGPLAFASALADASWPVLDIARAVVADGVSPVLCLNPSHGARQPGYDYADVWVRDLAFLRQHIPGALP